MGREVRTEIEIDASVQAVWKVLLDFDSFHQWNPFITHIQGKPEVGSQLQISVKFPNQNTMHTKANVLSVDECKRLRWSGKFLSKSLFEGTHSIELETISSQRCRLINREEYHGLLSQIIWKTLAQNANDGFMKMNMGLKGIFS